jgi:thiol-disulfide isomerase/thioredoxin
VILVALALTVAPPGPPALAGPWRAVLEQTGGPLLFEIEVHPEGKGWRGSLCNAGACEAFSAIRADGDSVRFEMAGYAAGITASLAGDSLAGSYQNVGRRGPRVIPFHASRGRWPHATIPPALAGRWDAWFQSGFESTPRVLELRNGPRGFEGTVLSNSGDYGLFLGQTAGDSVILSHFDGSYVYRVTARLEGDTLRGIFYAGLRAQTSFTATRSTGRPHLKPPTEITSADTASRFAFAFPDLDGRLVSQDDPRFRGKVLVVDIFGTWCPNCHDAAPALVDLYRRYRGRGLEMVGLAYEVTGDSAQDARQVRLYRDKYGITFPLLLAGISETETVAASLPQLINFTAFPTTIVVGRDGRIRRIRAGFLGPAVGPQHRVVVEELRLEVERALESER